MVHKTQDYKLGLAERQNLTAGWEADGPRASQDVFEHIRNTSLASVMGSMGAALTKMTQESPYAGRLRGVYREKVTFVEVRWLWLILPLATELLGIVCVGAVMLQSRNHAGLWKGTILAALYHGRLDENVVKSSGGKNVQTIADIKREARETNVRLRSSRGGMKVVLGW